MRKYVVIALVVLIAISTIVQNPILIVPIALVIAGIVIYKKNNKDLDDSKKRFESEKGTLSHEISGQSSAEPNVYDALPDKYLGCLLKYSYDHVKVCQIESEKCDIANLKIGLEVFVKQEPENKHDPKAVKLECKGCKIGYLYRGKMQDMVNDFENRGEIILAYIDDITADDIYISIGFYREPKHMYKNSFSFKLTGNSSAEIQENISFCSEDDEVTLFYDVERESYEVQDFEVIGYAPKSKNDFFDNTDAYYAYISEIDLKDNDKYSVTITVKY